MLSCTLQRLRGIDSVWIGFGGGGLCDCIVIVIRFVLGYLKPKGETVSAFMLLTFLCTGSKATRKVRQMNERMMTYFTMELTLKIRCRCLESMAQTSARLSKKLKGLTLLFSPLSPASANSNTYACCCTFMMGKYVKGGPHRLEKITGCTVPKPSFTSYVSASLRR